MWHAYSVLTTPKHSSYTITYCFSIAGHPAPPPPTAKSISSHSAPSAKLDQVAINACRSLNPLLHQAPTSILNISKDLKAVHGHFSFFWHLAGNKNSQHYPSFAIQAPDQVPIYSPTNTDGQPHYIVQLSSIDLLAFFYTTTEVCQLQHFFINCLNSLSMPFYACGSQLIPQNSKTTAFFDIIILLEKRRAKLRSMQPTYAPQGFSTLNLDLTPTITLNHYPSGKTLIRFK